MSDVKPADIKLVTDALEQYLNHARRIKRVDLKEFFRFMEPVFTKAGYRNFNSGGGQQPLVTF